MNSLENLLSLHVVLLFSLLNYFDKREIVPYIPSLIKRYFEFGYQDSIHEASGCFGWLREAWILIQLE